MAANSVEAILSTWVGMVAVCRIDYERDGGEPRKPPKRLKRVLDCRHIARDDAFHERVHMHAKETARTHRDDIRNHTGDRCCCWPVVLWSIEFMNVVIVTVRADRNLSNDLLTRAVNSGSPSRIAIMHTWATTMTSMML